MIGKSFKFLFWLITVLILLFLVVHYIIFNRYEISGGRSDSIEIERDGKVIVESTIVDWDYTWGYIAGLRLPVEYLDCHEHGYATEIRVLDSKSFFILDLRSGHLLNFQNEKLFTQRLSELGISDSVELDNGQFDLVWQWYRDKYKDLSKHTDLSKCTVVRTTLASGFNSESR